MGSYVGKQCNCRDEKGRKLGKNCPLLSRRDHGAWWVRYEAPPGPDGKRRRPWAGPYANKTLAEKALPALQAEADSGRPIPDRKLKVGPYLRQWLAGKKSLKESTRSGYLKHIELYLEPGIGHILLGELREHHLDALYEAMSQISREPTGEPSETLRRLLRARARATWGEDANALHNNRALSPARIRRVHATLSSALSAAYRQRKISHDPSKNIELPAARRRRPLLWTPERVERWAETGERPGPVMVWTPDHVGAFMDWLEEREDRLYPLYHLVATRGLRRAEVCNLSWVDTALEGARGTVSVLEGREDDDEHQGVKSDASRRVVSLDATNTALLRAWRQAQREDRLRAGKKWVDSGRVFTDELGAPLDLYYLSKRFARLVRLSGLPPVRLHDLRHCAATLMLAGGVDMKVVSATLGHTQYWFTADTYTSVLPQLAEAAADAAVALIPRGRRV